MDRIVMANFLCLCVKSRAQDRTRSLGILPPKAAGAIRPRVTKRLGERRQGARHSD